MQKYIITLAKTGTALVATIVATELMKGNGTGVRERLPSENIIRNAVIQSHKSTL